MRRRVSDGVEAIINAAAGLAVSASIVIVLRASGAWDAPVLAVAAVFFIASVLRSYLLRRLFRYVEGKHE